ncbi:hypothetical protein WR25_05325 [Diploscapter pachys]|uniref:Uncharacterized protein n=1 Tax=Diploscapter pachys TaxID=2018661 RepID=A0A2A2M1P9_9BILA|nr:hypothetical protein WR25_05325 [Diploscapter pachys]
MGNEGLSRAEPKPIEKRLSQSEGCHSHKQHKGPTPFAREARRDRQLRERELAQTNVANFENGEVEDEAQGTGAGRQRADSPQRPPHLLAQALQSFLSIDKEAGLYEIAAS